MSIAHDDLAQEVQEDQAHAHKRFIKKFGISNNVFSSNNTHLENKNGLIWMPF